MEEVSRKRCKHTAKHHSSWDCKQLRAMTWLDVPWFAFKANRLVKCLFHRLWVCIWCRRKEFGFQMETMRLVNCEEQRPLYPARETPPAGIRTARTPADSQRSTFWISSLPILGQHFASSTTVPTQQQGLESTLLFLDLSALQRELVNRQDLVQKC